jgi:hypothetical protein
VNPEHGPLTLNQSLTQAARGLVDETYYLQAYPEVADIGITGSEHFTVYGWKEGRIPAPWFDHKYLSNHAPVFKLGGGNPLIDLLSLTTGAPQTSAPTTTFFVDEADAIQEISGIKETDSILVIIHAFYPQDLDTFTSYLNRLGQGIQVLITCPPNAQSMCRQWAKQSGFKVAVVETVNKARTGVRFLP